jgi:hypothetical protein
MNIMQNQLCITLDHVLLLSSEGVHRHINSIRHISTKCLIMA